MRETIRAQFFKNLHYVVIDYVHIYRGMFGSHVATVIRRLKRVCVFYGVRPRFILCPAIIGNPKAYAEPLIDTAFARWGRWPITG